MVARNITTDQVRLAVLELGLFSNESVTSLCHTDLVNALYPFLKRQDADSARAMLQVPAGEDFRIAARPSVVLYETAGDQVLLPGEGLPTLDEAHAELARWLLLEDAEAERVRPLEQRYMEIVAQKEALLADGVPQEDIDTRFASEVADIEREYAEGRIV